MPKRDPDNEKNDSIDIEYIENISEVGGDLFKVKWYRIMLDEAHEFKNRASQSTFAQRIFGLD